MLVSLNWLKDFVEIDRSAEEIGDLLTMGGIEVEGVSHVGHELDKVFTAKILEITPHPNSEKLTLVRIGLGAGEATVVCGAPNIAVGQLVPYAAPGTVLPSGQKIDEMRIKGVLSPGMLCSEKELGLGEDASGILVLDEPCEPGLSLTKAFPFVKDTVLQTGVTPNRGDCLSILGTAREVAALTGKPWKIPDVPIVKGSTHVAERVRVDVPDVDLCPRYVVTMIEGVNIGPSPLEIRLKLTRAGVRPISNVVDATNLILMECGQPLHAFDFNLLEERRIVVRRCDPGETFVTLDGAERRLPENTLMIRDGKRSVALAGIMGGINSEIKENTSCVLIESACFERFGIRRTAKALGMATEASYRFERGVDPEGSLWAAHRVAKLIHQLAGGTILSGHLDVYPTPITRPAVAVRTRKTNSLLGLELRVEEISSHLTKLGIAVKPSGNGNDEIMGTPPSWRWDLDREEDMIEEVARLHGFQNIPVSMPFYRSSPDKSGENLNRIRSVNTLMNASGFSEVITMSFVSKDAAREFSTQDGDSGELALINPLSEDQSVMRTSLLPGILAVAKRNINFRCEDLKLYEVGKTFVPVPGEELPREDLRLAGMVTGSRYPQLWNLPQDEEVDFYDVKGALENLLEGLGVADVIFLPSDVPFLHPGKSANMIVAGENIGFLGEMSPGKTREHGLPGKAFMFEILLEPLFVRMRKERVFTPIPRYPYIERDLSVIVEEKVSGDMIKHLISRLGHDIIASVILFDLYRGKSIPEGCQSMAFRIRYQSEDRTLTDEEVQEVHSHVADALARELGATMRE
jgi:phenylalanyl-tRNA synthetase beta chain